MKKIINLLGLIVFIQYSLTAQFDGAVGTAGCQAIHWENPFIKDWATGCQVTRGYQDIATKNMLVTYGQEENAIGPAGESAVHAVSLGDSGIAILTFDIPIYDGDGYDFAVFENSINDYFLELAFVEVSSDGIRWVRFPATSLTPVEEQIDGFGRLDPRLIHNLAGKYRLGWGTPFDLTDLADSSGIDIQNITHVKIVDVIGCIQTEYATYDVYGNKINDPYPTDFNSGGFDLTGVAVMNGWQPSSIDLHGENTSCKVYPNPAYDFITIRNAPSGIFRIFNMTGKIMLEKDINESTFTVNIEPYPGGVYLIQVNHQIHKLIKY